MIYPLIDYENPTSSLLFSLPMAVLEGGEKCVWMRYILAGMWHVQTIFMDMDIPRNRGLLGSDSERRDMNRKSCENGGS
jgi:hypothetical protein